MVLSAVKIRIVMVAHAAVCIALGIACVILPHKIASSLAVYDHMAHEYTRLYGCLTLSVGKNQQTFPTEGMMACCRMVCMVHTKDQGWETN